METKAPDGYIIGENPITIRLTLKDEYKDYKAPYSVITNITNTPYNWTQSVLNLAYGNSNDGTGDDEKFIIEVFNNPGVELPATGGSVRNIYFLTGGLLMGIGILLKKFRH